MRWALRSSIRPVDRVQDYHESRSVKSKPSPLPGLDQVPAPTSPISPFDPSCAGPTSKILIVSLAGIARLPRLHSLNPPESSRSKRAPTGPKTLKEIMLNDCGLAVRGQGQVHGTRSDDGSSKLRMDVWNACLKFGEVGVKNIEVKG
jgi:hypothetical protein